MENYYKEKLTEGIKYQDFICRELLKEGIVIVNLQSKDEQYDVGENLLGLEIKYDKIMKESKRIYIETKEKANSRNYEYIDSGIYRNDNSWLYGIGDYDVFYIFCKKMLQRIHKGEIPIDGIYCPPRKDTSEGFCLPLEAAEKYASKIIRFKKKDVPLKDWE